MISVVTPTYNTPPETLARTWASLKAQTHIDWQWVVWDDSPDNHTWRQLWGYAADERYRLTAHRSMTPSGVNIGKVKLQAFMVAEGDILVELDHDDELTPDCLTEIENAFNTHPDIGFVYSDWAEINPAGEWCRYPDGWAFGYGDQYRLNDRWVMKAPPVNDVTIRHIVSAPNHVRAWRANVYHALGGHDSTLPVADDYELIVRTYLNTRIAHIPKLLYKQHISPNTAQRQRNGLIQSLVAEIAEKYADDITARSTELGLLKE